MKTIVKYLGPTVHDRQLSVADLQDVGVIAEQDLRFHAGNRHRVILDDADKSLLDFFEEDADFEVTEVPNKEAKAVEEAIQDGEPLDGDELAPEETPAAEQADTTGSESQASTASTGTTAGGRGARSTATS